MMMGFKKQNIISVNEYISGELLEKSLWESRLITELRREREGGGGGGGRSVAQEISELKLPELGVQAKRPHSSMGVRHC